MMVKPLRYSDFNAFLADRGGYSKEIARGLHSLFPMNTFRIDREGKGSSRWRSVDIKTETQNYRFLGCPALRTILQRSESHQNPDYNPAPVPVIHDMGRPVLKSTGSKISARFFG
jgi:hypothetical protein